MSETLKLTDLKMDSGELDTLELIRLNEDEMFIIPFTTDIAKVQLHYCAEPEIGGYVHCNGQDCVLCKAGKKAGIKYLLPVYMPASKCVGILPLSPSMRPHSLLPQILAAVDAGSDPKILAIRKETPYKFTVSTMTVQESTDLGEEVISKFETSMDNGEIDLETMYQKITNNSLAMVPSIKTILEIKGVA